MKLSIYKDYRHTREYWGGSFGHDRHHQQIFHLHLHRDDVLIIPQRIGSEAYGVFTTHTWGHHAAVAREPPWGKHQTHVAKDSDSIQSYNEATEECGGEHTEAYWEERGGGRDDSDMLAYRGHIFQLQCCLELNTICFWKFFMNDLASWFDLDERFALVGTQSYLINLPYSVVSKNHGSRLC